MVCWKGFGSRSGPFFLGQANGLLKCVKLLRWQILKCSIFRKLDGEKVNIFCQMGLADKRIPTRFAPDSWNCWDRPKEIKMYNHCISFVTSLATFGIRQWWSIERFESQREKSLESYDAKSINNIESTSK